MANGDVKGVRGVTCVSHVIERIVNWTPTLEHQRRTIRFNVFMKFYWFWNKSKDQGRRLMSTGKLLKNKTKVYLCLMNKDSGDRRKNIDALCKIS